MMNNQAFFSALVFRKRLFGLKIVEVIHSFLNVLWLSCHFSPALEHYFLVRCLSC